MPEIVPPPEITLHVPPAGVAVSAFVVVAQIAAFEVVLLAVPGSGFTVNVTSDVEPGQAPFDAIV